MRLLVAASMITVMTIIATSSCSSSSDTATNASALDASAADRETTATTWPNTVCGQCVTTQCASQRELCEVEPSCAAHTKCAEQCGAQSDGSVDSACLAKCPGGANTVASRARAAYDTCITTTALKTCDGCTKPAPEGSVNEVLDQTCGGSTETNPCFACEDQRCCKTFAACVAEPECKQQLQPCVVGCKGDAKCMSACYGAHPKGVLTWAQRQACMTVNCVKECGGVPDGGALDSCEDCGVRGACRESHARCAADEGCFLLRACLSATCPDITDTCIDSCAAKLPPSAKPLLDAWFSCVVLSCKSCQ